MAERFAIMLPPEHSFVRVTDAYRTLLAGGRVLNVVRAQGFTGYEGGPSDPVFVFDGANAERVRRARRVRETRWA